MLLVKKSKSRWRYYEPVVTVSTKTVKPPLGGLGRLRSVYATTGNGIPQKVLDKIFQPFFTPNHRDKEQVSVYR
jgi:signal transduction histidine kinase